LKKTETTELTINKVNTPPQAKSFTSKTLINSHIFEFHTLLICQQVPLLTYSVPLPIYHCIFVLG